LDIDRRRQRFWCGRAPPAAAYVYAEDRKGTRPTAHPTSFRGIVQVDGYTGFGQVVRERADASVKLALCWVHARRGFFGSARLDQVPRSSKATKLAKAMRYSLRHWEGLTRFLDDGRLELDTNTVEREIRPITLGRKNALFAGNDAGAEHWAICATLIASAKLNGCNPLAYLTDMLERIIAGRTKITEIEDLLPWNWQPATIATLQAAA
jgi:hypothetical protein